MKIYVLVASEEGQPSVNMPVYLQRQIRAYTSKARARVYARKFNCAVVEVDISSGKIIADETIT